jgi:NADPH-dependent glutamate synthase beta subunit-like oxidoreductase
VPGRDLNGIHFAMGSCWQNEVNAGDKGQASCGPMANVIVIGGGDTGSDCVEQAARRGQSTQFGDASAPG